MKAYSITKPGTVETVNVPDPTPSGNEILIDVRRIGLCGTDLRTFTGDNPIVEYPRIIGHEVGAVVAADTTLAGEAYPAGTVVTVIPYTACGSCHACRSGRANACRYNETLGNQRDGAATEQFAVPADHVLPLPELTLDQAVCVEPLSVGFHAARRGGIGESDTVVVIGVGMIGLGAVAGAAARGARVIAVDLDDRKLDVAAQLGAENSVNAARVGVPETVSEILEGEDPSVVIEAIGSPVTYRQAIELVAFTGRVVYIGYAKEDVCFTTKYFVAKELDIRGSRNASAEDFAAVADTLRRGGIATDSIITHRFPMEAAADAFGVWTESPDAVTKIVLER